MANPASFVERSRLRLDEVRVPRCGTSRPDRPGGDGTTRRVHRNIPSRPAAPRAAPKPWQEVEMKARLVRVAAMVGAVMGVVAALGAPKKW